MVKLWHDDIRKPPNGGWRWARTNEEAIQILETENVAYVSLDHDLGCHEVNPDDENSIYLQGDCNNGNGMDLVRWMIENDKVPPRVTIHSWNIPAADNMHNLLKDLCECKLEPFKC